MADRPLRVVLIGCGWHALASHAPALTRYVAEHPGLAKLVAVCDRDGARANLAAGQFGAGRDYTDIDTMLDAERPDAAVCVMPVSAVAEQGACLLERGLATLLEKPLGPDIASARRLEEVARRTGTPHMVSLNRRFAPALTAALAQARQIGPLRYVRGTMVRPGRRERAFLWATGIHVLDATIACGGELTGFSVRPMTAGDGPRWSAVDLTFAGGAQGTVEVLPSAGVNGEAYELFGEGYRIFVEVRVEPRVTLWRDGAEPQTQAFPAEPEDIADGTYAETCAFLDALAAGRAPAPTVADALVASEIAALL